MLEEETQEEVYNSNEEAEESFIEYVGHPVLLQLKKFVEKEKPTYWTMTQLIQIVTPLYQPGPEEISQEEIAARIELLDMSDIDYEKLEYDDPEMLEFLEGPFQQMAANASLLSSCEFSKDKPTVTVDELYPAFKPLLQKPSNQWSSNEVDALVKLLIGRMSVDARGSNSTAVDNWNEFSIVWEEYLEQFPIVKRKLDPVFVIADIGGSAFPPNFLSSLKVYPSGKYKVCCNSLVGPLPALSEGLNGSKYFWAFPGTPAGHKRAQHLIGYLQGANVGLHLWKFTANHIPTYF